MSDLLFWLEMQILKLVGVSVVIGLIVAGLIIWMKS